MKEMATPSFVPCGEFPLDAMRPAVTTVRVSVTRGVSAGEFVKAVGRMKGVVHRADDDRETPWSKITGWQVHYDCTDDATAAKLVKRIEAGKKYNGLCVCWQRSGIV
jgi:hypothetical protein